MKTHSGTHSICLFLIGLLTLGLTSCRKNAFSLDGKLAGGDAGTIYLSWRAASNTQDALVTQAVPLTPSGFHVEGPVKFPTVVWIMSSGRKLLAAVYVERGDKLNLTGSLDKPQLWQYKGNDVMKQVSEWERDNMGALVSHAPALINKAVADYVKAHGSSRTALFLLLTAYDRGVDPKGFDRLIAPFRKEKFFNEMQDACLEPKSSARISLPADRAKRIREVLDDTTQNNASTSFY